MKKRMVALPLSLLLLAGCAAKAPVPEQTEATASPAASVYAIVVKNTENPYMTVMVDGFRRACAEMGAAAMVVGPGASGEPSQAEILESLIALDVDAIAVAANERASVSATLRRAMDAGIAVVSLDSVVGPDERNLHIQQASPEMIGRVLIQAGARMLDGEGTFAILTTTETMPNQASWVAWMRRELSDYPEKYARMRLVETAYGLDEAAPSAAETRRLLETYPALDLIIAPTSAGIRAAAEVLRTAGTPTRITGLGLPSEMEPYIMENICPWMYLWNPAELGYLAAYAANALVAGTLTGAVDEILRAGEMGDRIVTVSEDGGTEIVLGHPKVFDLTNIAVWRELF